MSQKELNKTSTYWDKRRLSRYNQNEKATKKYINKIKRIYSRSNKEVQKMIDDVYRNYSINTGIDTQKLKTLLSKSQTEKTFKELKKQGLDQYVKENYKARISHLEQIQAQIYAKAKEIYPEEQLQQEMAYKGVVNSNYYKTIYDIEQNTGFMYNFSRIDDNMLNAVLSERWSGKNFSERIWVNTDILADSLSEIIGSSLISGQGVEKTARDIRERFNVSKYYSERLVRTEMNYFDNQADMMAYEELGIEEYVLVATLDMKTSPYCIEIDGKHFPYDKIEVGKNYPPFHPNCRCTTRGYLGKDAEKMMDRVAINPDTGKRETIPNMTYKEWAKRRNIPFNETDLERVTRINKEKEEQIDKLVPQIKLSDKEHKACTDVYNKYLKNNTENVSIIDMKTQNRLGNIASQNKDSRVDFSEEQLDIMSKSKDRSLIAIHNHPANSTFSLRDIKTCLEYDKIGGIMVVTDNYIYSLKPKYYLDHYTKEQLETFDKWLEKRLGKQNEMLLGKYPQYSNNQLNHIAYKNIFDKIGWEYGREKRKK